MRLIFLTAIACTVCKCRTKWPDSINRIAYVDNPVESGFPGHWLPIDLIKRIMESRVHTLVPNVDKSFHDVLSRKPLFFHKAKKKTKEHTYDVKATKAIVKIPTVDTKPQTEASRLPEMIPKIIFDKSSIISNVKTKLVLKKTKTTNEITVCTRTHSPTDSLTKVSSTRGANIEDGSNAEVNSLDEVAEQNKAVSNATKESSLEMTPSNTFASLLTSESGIFKETVSTESSTNPLTEGFTVSSTELTNITSSTKNMTVSSTSITESTSSRPYDSTEVTATSESATTSIVSTTSTAVSTSSATESTTSMTESTTSTTESTSITPESTTSTTEPITSTTEAISTTKSMTVLTMSSPTTTTVTSTTETGNPFY
ncbi:uncharacterized protein DDB_G0271670 [Bicyclus anynana]|uniref:Uncharacterized protein DDB_G0271670 n=1 Tax=Bicyclus anynana TaxID=110368 RepID=A0ABM3LYH3_BICAN|nr:uncharacterized protein DDB_G0271670 [Bicyclus anynana]